MEVLVPKWNDDRNKVKDIFDCIRNSALSGLVFFIGVYNFRYNNELLFFKVLSALSGSLMILFALYLFWLNIALFNKIVREEHRDKNVGNFFYYVIPFCVSILAVALLFNSTYSLELDNGKPIGKSTLSEIFDSSPIEESGKP
ncbi:hypothetical protein Glaag_4372 (plasmid) [Glaciecola sp. 4H-3-7+YE-5]|uniref:Uncharacterized protein n=2 Tax=Paraglaciecola chathamensis TaxID=368405 RepID=A0A8H9M6P1_9ALTE|nr:hypothetical protein Glaag_4372 [Glaciecola sp. 4H-3-7+YE-5]GGZ82783.1 hypothetical protein GCM10011274_45620 [Paraglaciecola oceanifecundans]